MKDYYCSKCEDSKFNKPFHGNRQMVRKHIQEEHLIKSIKEHGMMAENTKYHSPITRAMGRK